nr:putative reverse transcriptase domain-containing protein [Tanacetum cinerariifolium]
SKEEHEVHLKVVLELLKKELFAKLSKCEIRLQGVHFFRQVVINNDFHVEPSKIEVVKNWKVPKTPTKIRLFLGLAGKMNIVVRALSRKEQVKPGRLRSMDMTIQSRVKRMILAAQSEAFKEENKPAKRLHGLDQQMKSKEDGGCTLRINYGIHWIVPFFETMLVHQGEGSGTPTEPHHIPFPEADTSSHPTTSSIPLLSIPTAPIPPVTQPDLNTIRQYSRRARIAQSSTLPHDSAPRVTSPAADEGREAAAERISNDSGEVARVLTSMDAATVLAAGIDVPTGSGFIPTAGPPATSTARIETTDEGTHILATVDGIQRTVSESSLRRNLKLRDEDGIVSIPDTELFENLTLMGIVPLFDTMLVHQGEGSDTPTEPHHTPFPEV